MNCDSNEVLVYGVLEMTTMIFNEGRLDIQIPCVVYEKGCVERGVFHLVFPKVRMISTDGCDHTGDSYVPPLSLEDRVNLGRGVMQCFEQLYGNCTIT